VGLAVGLHRVEVGPCHLPPVEASRCRCRREGRVAPVVPLLDERVVLDWVRVTVGLGAGVAPPSSAR
jgi:hypothetical protein